MPKAGRFVMLLLVVLSFVGCATKNGDTGKYSMRGYVQDEPRVDQTVSGKVGNWQNAPEAVDVDRKKTRQVYYLEMTKEADEADETITVEDTTETESITTEEPEPPTASAPPPQKRAVPTFEDEPATSAKAVRFSQYTVEKDDTLQKISMKFYNTTKKWPQLYEVNKDIIKNPNFIKPGITIRIPAL